MILRPIFEKLFKFRETVSRKNKVAAGADEGFDPHEKPFLDHLEDLRHTLMKVIIALVITTILGFTFHETLLQVMQKPLQLAKMTDADGNPTGTTLADHVRFIVLSPPEVLMLSIKVSFFAGLIGAFPLLVFFIGEFVVPGLRQQEKKLVIPGICAGFFLFILGGSFAFFMATPIAMKFFHEFEREKIGFIQPKVDQDKSYVPIRRSSEEVKTVTAAEVAKGGAEALEKGSEPEGEAKNAAGKTAEADAAVQPALQLPKELQDKVLEYLLQLIVVEQGSEITITFEEDIGKIAISTGIREMSQYRIGEYISFVTRLVLVFGLSFQLPVVVTILSKLQLLTARVMRNTRAFAWVIMLVLSAIFTPPDVFTLGLLAGPLILLYEICIWIAWSIERNREKAKRTEEEEERQRLETLYSKPADELSEEEKAELNRREIEQYEREHEHLHDDHYDDDHDHGHHDGDGHDDPDHPGIKPDPHLIGHDPQHDESWDSDHDEHGNPYHNDPYHGDSPDHHDPHEDAEAHQPIQDWPDREDESDSKDKEKSDSDESESAGLESDHAEPSDAGDDDVDTDKDPNGDDENHEPCAPTGAIINPNVATLEELITLPGVDDELADHMILYRPFNNFDELLEVPGMDDDILNAIIDRLNLE